MNCESVRQLLNSYVDGETGGEDTRLIAAHLAGCASCTEEARLYLRTRSLAAEYGAEHAPAGFLDDLKSKIQNEPAKRPPAPFTRYRNSLALAATFLIVLLGGAYFGILKTGTGLRVDGKLVDSMPDTSTPSTASTALSGAAGLISPAETGETSAETTPRAAPNYGGDFQSTLTTPAAGVPGTPADGAAPGTASSAPREPAGDEEAPGFRGIGSRNEPRAAGGMSPVEAVRKEVRKALDEKEIELAEEAAPDPEEEPGYRTRGLAFAVDSRERAAAPPVVPVSYSPGHAGFNYFNVPSGSDVMEFVVRNSLAVQPAERTEAKTSAAAGAITPGNYVRAASVFISADPARSSGDCEEFIRKTLAGAKDPYAALQRNGAYFIVKGSFSTLAPLRVRLMQEFSPATATGSESVSDGRIAAAASATYGIPPDYPAVLEVQFLKK